MSAALKWNTVRTAYLSMLFTVLSTKSLAGIIHVPADQPTLQSASDAALPGDTLLLAPGTYSANLVLSKDLTIASWYLTTGEESYIQMTVVDGGGTAVFYAAPPVTLATSIIGLTIRNGEDGVMARAPLNLLHNHITACGDGIDYESGGGGLCMSNTFVNNTDDGIDLDGTLLHLIIENNIIYDNDDDGIEIRLHDYTGEPSWCRIANNRIYNNGEDGIQFIDYPDTTNRIYLVERNLIYDNTMAGIACMDLGITIEDYRGAAIPEAIYLVNNTIIGNDHGLAGGARLLAVNNLICNNNHAGAKNVSGNSIISHCLFYNNGEDLVNCLQDGSTNIFSDPRIDDNYVPVPGSPCIDAGTPRFIVGQDTILNLPEDGYFGTAPDIGAFESNITGADLMTAQRPALIVRPVPFHDCLEILSPADSYPCRLQFINQYGMIILDLAMQESHKLFDLSFYPAGVYYIRYIVDNEIYIKRIIKI